MSYGLAWLQNQNALRCILVEAVAKIAGVETTFYLSTRGYITEAGEAPASTNYVPCIVGGLQITETLPLDGTASIAYGDIEIVNLDGSRDAWLDYVWANRSVKVYVGDVSWARADFQLVFDGILEDIDSKNYDKLNLKIRDKLQRLNGPISEAKLGTGDNPDSLIPLTFGECCNVTPLLSNPATLEYQVHNGPIESIIEVRDNGVPVTGFTPSLATGKFTLTTAPAGIITCSIQGDKPSTYANTVAATSQRIVKDFGKVSSRFVSGDLDSANLSAFESANTQAIGVYLTARENIITIIQQLSSSIGAQATITREGKFALLRIVFPPAGTPTDIGEADILVNSLHISDRPAVRASTKVGYCKNWTVQNNLLTGIPEEHKKLFYDEYFTITQTDGTVVTDYKLDIEPIQRDTLLLNTTEATAEANRELDIYKTPRHVVSFDGFPQCLLLTLGQAVTITHHRFGLEAGKTGVVVSLQTDWINFKVTAGVLL